ncbi:hypothetical protein EVAR_50708_1 [Eumeta japonica]|uniref:Uncharacterized protein n=1 Tax=Eumeta variegata TaxID=151549 RepID=A0A4C1YMS0_EUMVA|nr:hypothetical protein EVAR_50708_1 [Eumeta japonica]
MQDKCKNNDVRKRCGLKEDVVAKVEKKAIRQPKWNVKIQLCLFARKTEKINMLKNLLKGDIAATRAATSAPRARWRRPRHRPLTFPFAASRGEERVWERLYN